MTTRRNNKRMNTKKRVGLRAWLPAAHNSYSPLRAGQGDIVTIWIKNNGGVLRRQMAEFRYLFIASGNPKSASRPFELRQDRCTS
jgi:hypothetical protein